MDDRVLRLYKKRNIQESTLKNIMGSWDETVKELSEHGINIDYFVGLVEESDGGGNSEKSFGEHVLHKITKAVTIIRGFSGQDRKNSLTSVISDLEQINEYASTVRKEERSFLGAARWMRK